ncbi:MAG: DNRLRE domain-containing protein [Planctomycetes bacterium]|nr:DNRLRE domain-containing protein [Planctomycetota bacterium]
MRIPEKEIQEGRAVRMDERLYCAKCCPAPATKAVPKAKHTSEAKILLATPRPAQHPISDGSLKAHARGARAHDPRSGRAVRQEGLSKPMLAGILAAVAGVLLLALVFMGGSKPDQAHNTRPDVPDIPKASGNPSSSSPTGSTSVRKPDPPRAADVVPPAGANLPPAGSSREDQAEKAYATLLAESAGHNVFSRKKMLKEFIDAYSDTIVAARARVELARVESPQPDPAQPVATAQAAATAGTTYVLQQGHDGYAGCEDTFLYSYHPKVTKHTQAELSCGRGMVPVIRFAIFKSEGGPVPDGAQIISAKLDLERSVGDPMELNVYPLLKDCQLAAATWEEAALGLAWDEAGAAAKGKDYGSEPLATLPVERTMTTLGLDLTAGVRNLAGGEKNRGWVLHGGQNNWNYYRIQSSESPATDKRPKLTVVVAGDAKTAGAAAVAGAIADGLVLYLPFDDKEGNAVKDASGAGNNAQIEGAPDWQDGKFGGALHLNGRDCRVVLGRLAVNAQPGAKNTVSMWVRFGKFENMLFSWAGRGALFFGRGNFGFNTQSSDILGIPCTDLALHEWIHLVAVFPNDIPNEQNATLYLNGKRVAIAQVVGRPKESQATSDATIGVMFKPTNYHIDATVDEFRLYNRELSEAEAAALYAAGAGAPAQPVPAVQVAAPAPVPGDGLVLHLPFRKPGDEFKEELSGRGCRLELKNGATALTTARGYALNLPRGQAYAEVEGLAVDTRPGAKNTVVFWMYARDIGSAMPFAWKGQNYCMYLNTTGFGFNSGEAGNILGVDSTRIKPKEWVHVAAVFPNGVPNLENVALYLNGQRTDANLVAAALPTRSVSASSGVYLGGIPTGNYFFNGLLQDVRIYNREISPEEVKAVFENKPRHPPSAPAPAAPQDLVLHLPFDEKSGDVAKDASGNGHDAALKNGPQFVAGRIGGALKFDGTDDYAEIADFDYGPDFTLSFWFSMEPNPDKQFQYLFGHGVYDKTNSCLVYVDLHEKKLRTYLRDGNDGHIVREYDIPYDGLGNWIHYAVQVTREEGLKIYLDGKLLKTGRHGKKGVKPKTALTLGIRWDLDRERIFTGALDDLRLYNRALSDDEIAALAEGKAPVVASGPAAEPQLSADDKALDERLKRWRVLWGAGETKSLRDDIEALRKAGGAAAEQTAVAEAALAARGAAWKQVAALQGRAGLRLALANGETQAGKIERLDGERFEFNLGGLVTRYQLGDLAWETFRGWAEAQMTGDAEKQKKLTASALLTSGVDAEKEADAALRTAWAPLFASAGRVDANLKNDAVWAEILGLVKAQKWPEVNERALGLLNAPPGGVLSAELKEKVDKLLAESKASSQAELSKPENLPLQVRAKALDDGRLELRYDFSNPRQLQDFEGLDANFVRIEGGALNLSTMNIRHKLEFVGDLAISYDAASTATKPHRLCTAFYDLRGEFGFEGKDETAFWHALNQPGKTVKTNPLVGKQWNRVDIQFTAATKLTRIAVNGAECMNSANPNSAGRGHVQLAAYHPFLVRNLVISGKPAADASEAILRSRVFAEALQKKLAQGETVPVFTAEDQANWDLGLPGSWRFVSGVANGEGALALPGLALRDYEAEMDVRLADADRFRVIFRQGAKDRHHALVTPRGVSVYATDRLANYAVKEVGKPNNADGKAWHHLTVQSKGSALKIVLDGKEVLFEDQQVGTDSMGLYFQTEGGKASIRNVTVKALR